MPGAVLVASALTLTGTACGEDGVAEARADSDTSAAPSTAPSTSTSSTTVPELKGASTATVSVPASGIETAELQAVRLGTHDGYDRVVFELEGQVPGYDIGYLQDPPVEAGSGAAVEVDGDHVLSVRMAPASGVVIGVDEIIETYVGQDRIAGDGRPITEVVRAGDFEAQSTWMIGVDGERPFTVSTLDSPTRIIVDIAES